MPWIAVAVVVALLLGGLSFGYVLLTRRGCDGGPTTIAVLASPDQFKTMASLGQQWQDTKPEVDGKCVGVDIHRKEPGGIAAALSPNWDPRRDGPQPVVWAPDSSAWALVAAERPEAAAMLRPNPARLASSPVVIAMPRPMAEALGWPDKELGWRDLMSTFGLGKSWADFAPDQDWGKFRLGMADPAASTAGLHALFAVTDLNDDDEVTDEELKSGLVFEHAVSTYVEDTGKLFEGLAKADGRSREEALAYISAFPARECDIAAYNATNPNVPLAALYPKEGAADADYPYLILKAPWVDSTRQQIAEKFLSFLRSDTGLTAYGKAGFRQTNRSTAKAPALTTERGFRPKVAAPPRTLASAESVTRTVVTWTALRRRANVLAVLDTSGSMADPVPGLPASKLRIVQEAATRATGLFSNDTKLGLWQFSSKLTPTTDYRELVPITPTGGEIRGVPARAAIVGAIRGMRPKGGTGLYDTAYAAYLESQEHWELGRINIVVLMTDGKNEDDVGLNRAQLISRLKSAVRPDRPVQIVTIAYGADADVGSLQEISRATGGRTFVSRNPADVEKVFIAALFGSR
jgi:Ca-activated chloride channel family protein